MLIIGQRRVDRILVMFQTFSHPKMNPRCFTINGFAVEATMLFNYLTCMILITFFLVWDVAPFILTLKNEDKQKLNEKKETRKPQLPQILSSGEDLQFGLFSYCLMFIFGGQFSPFCLPLHLIWWFQDLMYLFIDCPWHAAPFEVALFLAIDWPCPSPASFSPPTLLLDRLTYSPPSSSCSSPLCRFKGSLPAAQSE